MVNWPTILLSPSLQTPTSTQVAHQVKELKFCADHMVIVNSVEQSAPWRTEMKMHLQTHTCKTQQSFSPTY